MTNEYFIEACNYLMVYKSVRMRELSKQLGFSYTYFTKMMAGKALISDHYKGKRSRHLQENQIDIPNFSRKKDYIAEEKEDIKKMSINEENSHQYQIKKPAMTPGSSFKITTQITVANDIVTGYNVDLTRIS